MQVISSIFRLLFDKKNELGGAADKLRNGLSKIDDTRQKVEKMSIELEDAKTKVAQFQKQCDEYLVIIVQQKREADEQQKVRGRIDTLYSVQLNNGSKICSAVISLIFIGV
jgi:dynein heavy chain